MLLDRSLFCTAVLLKSSPVDPVFERLALRVNRSPPSARMSAHLASVGHAHLPSRTQQGAADVVLSAASV
jgi:hypothetical protein